MARNLKKENNWRKGKYEKFGADLDIEFCKELKDAIKKDKAYTSIADWIRQNGEKYLKKLSKNT